MKNSRKLILLVLTLACFGVSFFLAPQQLPVMVYKLALALLGAWAFFWLDTIAFPYSRPGSYLMKPWKSQGKFIPGQADFEIVPGYEMVFIVSTLRRAFMMVVGGALGMALGV